MKYREKMKRLKEIVQKGSISEDTIKFVEKCTQNVRTGKYAGEVPVNIKKYSVLQDRINELHECENITDEDMDIIEDAASSMYDSDRAEAAELLIKANSERAKKLLYKPAEDKCDIVRVSAYDSLGLGNFRSEELYVYFLGKLNKEASRLARGYIISNLIDMYKESGIGNRKELLEIFSERLEKTEGIEKAVSLCLLVLLGEEGYIKDIFEGFNCEDPYVRLWYLIAAGDIADKNNYKLISERV
ncbi:MAG: hypothetical protein IJ736_05015, partial [Firmicutes bacterium]|nr:hypothetical protein [Bacillota bacterium]